MDTYTKTKIEELSESIRQGKVVLFLGAGATQASGGPSGKTLGEMIKEKFVKIDQNINNLLDICQDVIETPPYNRNQLESFIREKLETLQPTDSHKILTKFDWSAIFTTNYDDLIELSYRINIESRLKRCQSLYTDTFSANIADKSLVYLFKIMGCIRASEEETGAMILSRTDFNRALSKRKKYFDILFDVVKNGTVLFIGYSFVDRIMLEIIDLIIDQYGMDRLPHSYALFDKVPTDEKNQNILRTRKITPLECDFVSFFGIVDTLSKGKIQPAPTRQKIFFKLRGFTLECNEEDFMQYAEFFDILGEHKLQEAAGDRDSFFKGINKSWGAYRENLDFKRDLYVSPTFKRIVGKQTISGCLKDKVFGELKKFDSKENKVILLKGMAGGGKTTILKRLAFDVYSSGEAPVIFIKTTRIGLDFRLLSGFLEDLNNQLNQKIQQGQRVPPIKALIIFDNAASSIRDINRLKDYLVSRGRLALIIAADRSSEWDLAQKSFAIGSEDIFELGEQLTSDEKVNIIEHFYQLGYISTKGTHWNYIIDNNYENYFFATIYSMVDPTKKPLSQIINDQYQKLTDNTQAAFKYICAFHQFDLPINQELLVRALKCGYDLFLSEVMGKDSAKVIFEEQDPTGVILYRSHHRIIAQLIVRNFFNDPEIQKNIFIKILTEANLSIPKEREICQKLLISYLGPNAKPKLLTFDQQRQIFQAVCAENPLRSLLHHWGLIEMEDGKFEEAEKLLRRALEVPRDEAESYRRESEQNILTSLGNLYSHVGIQLLKEKKSPYAEEYFRKAEECFHAAKHGEFPNGHAYHSHAYMFYFRAITIQDDALKIDYLIKGLEILAVAKDNLNEDELQPIYELEEQIRSQIKDEKAVEEIAEVIKNKFNSPRGYYLWADFLMCQSKDKSGDERKNLLKSAMEKINLALSTFKNDEHCLRLKCNLIKLLEPQNFNGQYKALKDWKLNATIQSITLLFELGRTAFILEYYDDSKEYFKELDAIGTGHRLRSRPRDSILDDKGNNKEFEGHIIYISSNNLEGGIKCDSLRNLRYSISFRPIACKFKTSVNDAVKFTIEFNFRGPRAENVKKI